MGTGLSLSRQLCDCVERNDVEAVKRLLQMRADVNSRNEILEWTVLIMACSAGNIAMVELLLKKGAAVNETDLDGDTALIQATKKGYGEIVELLLKRKADVNHKGLNGRTAMHWAADNNFSAIVNLLINSGAEVDMEDNEGKSPLWYAVLKGHVTCFDLLNHGANPFHNSGGERSPYDLAKERDCSEILDKMQNDATSTVTRQGRPCNPSASLPTAQELRHLTDMQSEGAANISRSMPPVEARREHCRPVASGVGRDDVMIRQPFRQVRHDEDEEIQTTELRRELQNQMATESREAKLLQVMLSTQGKITTERPSDLLQQNERLRHVLEEYRRQNVAMREELKQPVPQRDADVQEQDHSELDAAVAENRAMKTELAKMKQQNEALWRIVEEERRERALAVQQKSQLEHSLTEQEEERIRLQRDLNMKRGERERVQQEVVGLRRNESRLEELLAAAETALTQEMETKEVRKIPSIDIRLSNHKLGEGSFGVVRIAFWRGCPVAVKMLHEVLAGSQHNIGLLQQEVSVAWRVHHPNVAAVCGMTLELNERDKRAWIVMELLQGSVSDVIEYTRQDGVAPLSLREKVDITVDSLCGLSYLHCLPRVVYHGDVRPTNILVTEVMRAKLGDLGAARFGDASLSVGLVSPLYTATERLDRRTAPKSTETDVYSMGVSVCELFTGLPPTRPNRLHQIQQIKQREIRFLSLRMVADNPNRRPTAAEALGDIELIRRTQEYKADRPRRLVKGKLDGVDKVTLTDRMW